MLSENFDQGFRLPGLILAFATTADRSFSLNCFCDIAVLANPMIRILSSRRPAHSREWRAGTSFLLVTSPEAPKITIAVSPDPWGFLEHGVRFMVVRRRTAGGLSKAISTGRSLLAA